MRRLLLVLAGLAVSGLAAWLLLRGGGAQVRWETTAVDRGRVQAKVTAGGTLSALVTVQVGSQVSGRVVEVCADFNDSVRKGQVLARLDPQLFQGAVAQAEASVMVSEGNLARARTQAADAQRQADRARALLAQQIVTQAEVDTAVANAEAAEASVQVAQGSLMQARAALDQARTNLGYTTILCPTDGVVISRSVDVGQTVAASLQVAVLFTIAEDLRKMQVDTNVSEADVGRIQPGMAASFRVDAWPEDSFIGTVRQVRNAPQVLQNVVTYDAVIDVDNPRLRLRPGMTANVTFIVAEAEDALRIPNAALRFRPPRDLAPKEPASATAAPAEEDRPQRGARPGSGQRPGGGERGRIRARAVWVLRQGRPERIPVQTGVSDGSFTELTGGGLAEGDLVITEAVDPAAEGQPTIRPPGVGGMRRLF